MFLQNFWRNIFVSSCCCCLSHLLGRNIKSMIPWCFNLSRTSSERGNNWFFWYPMQIKIWSGAAWATLPFGQGRKALIRNTWGWTRGYPLRSLARAVCMYLLFPLIKVAPGLLQVYHSWTGATLREKISEKVRQPSLGTTGEGVSLNGMGEARREFLLLARLQLAWSSFHYLQLMLCRQGKVRIQTVGASHYWSYTFYTLPWIVEIFLFFKSN